MSSNRSYEPVDLDWLSHWVDALKDAQGAWDKFTEVDFHSSSGGEWDMEYARAFAATMNSIPALIAELRELRARSAA